MFCSGIDLQFLTANNMEGDVGRNSIRLIESIETLQLSLQKVRSCNRPVIAVAHRMAVGLGLELFAASDIRFATEDTIFSIREPRMGLAADVGGLQRMPKLCNNQSLAFELAITGRDFDARFAEEKLGFLTCVPGTDVKKALEKAFAVATEIAAISPVVTYATKKTLLYGETHSVEEGLEYIRNLNSGLLQSEDVKKAVMAKMSGQPAQFSKL